MPTNKRESLIFTVIMCACMVYGMSVYNVALIQGGLSAETFAQAWMGFPPGYIVAMCCDWFIAGRLAKGFAFRFLVKPGLTRPSLITLAVSSCMVVPMVVLMSLYGSFEAVFHTGAAFAAVPAMWLRNIPVNFVMALPLNLLVAGPIARAAFRRAFPLGTVLEYPVELAPEPRAVQAGRAAVDSAEPAEA